jgi:hypothetical protein
MAFVFSICSHQDFTRYSEPKYIRLLQYCVQLFSKLTDFFEVKQESARPSDNLLLSVVFYRENGKTMVKIIGNKKEKVKKKFVDILEIFASNFLLC